MRLLEVNMVGSETDVNVVIARLESKIDGLSTTIQAKLETIIQQIDFGDRTNAQATRFVEEKQVVQLARSKETEVVAMALDGKVERLNREVHSRIQNEVLPEIQTSRDFRNRIFGAAVLLGTISGAGGAWIVKLAGG